MVRTRTSSSTIAALVVTAALLGGCSGSDDSADSDDSAAATTTSAAPTTTEAPAASTTEAVDAPVETTSVDIEGYAFDPKQIRVSVGDTVTWTNLDEFQHTSTADDDLWDSGALDAGASFEHTFTEAGTYPYLCNIHNYMTATVVVE